jgi:hypothetical protein
MKVCGCLAVFLGWIAVSAPSFAADLAASHAPQPHRLGLTPIFSRPFSQASTGRLDARVDRPLPVLEAVTGSAADEWACSLQTLSEPELLAPPAAPGLLFRPGEARPYPSLGGPALTLTSPDALPSLRDPAAAPAAPEDTLRLFRSHW